MQYLDTTYIVNQFRKLLTRKESAEAERQAGSASELVDRIADRLSLKTRARDDALRYGQIPHNSQTTDTQREIVYYCRDLLTSSQTQLDKVVQSLKACESRFVTCGSDDDLERVPDLYGSQLQRLTSRYDSRLSQLDDDAQTLSVEYESTRRNGADQQDASDATTAIGLLIMLSCLCLVATYFLDNLVGYTSTLGWNQLLTISVTAVIVPAAGTHLLCRIWEGISSIKSIGWVIASIFCLLFSAVAASYVIQGAHASFIESATHLLLNQSDFTSIKPDLPTLGVIMAASLGSFLATCFAYSPDRASVLKRRIVRTNRLYDRLRHRQNRRAMRLLHKANRSIEALSRQKASDACELINACDQYVAVRSNLEDKADSLNQLCNVLLHRYLSWFSQINWNGQVPDYQESQFLCFDDIASRAEQIEVPDVSSILLGVKQFRDNTRRVNLMLRKEYSDFLLCNGAHGLSAEEDVHVGSIVTSAYT